MFLTYPWWRHQMGTFSALLVLCVGNSSVTGEFPTQRPVTRSFDVFFDLCLNKRLNKQRRRRWFGTPLRSLWRHIFKYYSVLLLNQGWSRYSFNILHAAKRRINDRCRIYTFIDNFSLALCHKHLINTIQISNVYFYWQFQTNVLWTQILPFISH